jgi:hypothetical protein
VPPIEAKELPPKKVAWLHPGQLIRTAYHVWLSTVASEYLDRRETLAALDTARAPKKVSENSIIKPGTVVDAFLPVRPGRGVSIDYVADIGDSWQATYSIAKLLVTDDLRVRGHDATLKPADVVVLGGDLVYPTPSRERYRRRTRSPLLAARPSINGHEPGLFAIPGNHDWYDGLTNFVREFCQGRHIGGWSMFQRRSYFAVKLTDRWWLWGIDIALDTRIDLPQQTYFLNVMNHTAGEPDERFQAGDNIILCTAKPAWLDDEKDSDGYRNLTYFVQEIIEKDKDEKGHKRVNGRVRVILAGDDHHYSRYKNQYGDHMITAGGGGAYLTGTHHLPRTVPDLCTPADESGLEGPAAGDQPRPKNEYQVADFPYPSRSASRRLALGALLLAFRPANWPFVLLVGFVYWFFAWTLIQAERDVFSSSLDQLLELPFRIALTPSATPVFFILLATLVICATVPVASKPSARRALAIPWGLAHGLLHLLLALFLARLIDQSTRLDGWAVALPYNRFSTETVFSLSLVLLGGMAGATLVGIYFVLSDFLFMWHSNEVFAVQSIINYRNFLKMHIAPNGELTILPIGLRKVPKKWRLKLDRKTDEPLYESSDCVLDPHLIEGPIKVPRR